MRKAAAPAFAACITALGVGTASASAPTTSTWAHKANRICASTLTQVHALPKPAADYLPTAQYLDRSASIVSKATTTLSALPTPQATRPTIGRWIALEWQGVKLVRQMAAAFRAHDLATVQSIGGTDKQRSARADAIAIQLGATTCAQS